MSTSRRSGPKAAQRGFEPETIPLSADTRGRERMRAIEDLIRRSSIDAAEGGAAVAETLASLRMIASSFSVLEEIARRSGLLALYAALEAARAEDFGQGFTFMAKEAGRLAERSRRAALEISLLAKGSAAVAERAGNSISRIMPNMRKASRMMLADIGREADQVEAAAPEARRAERSSP